MKLGSETVARNQRGCISDLTGFQKSIQYNHIASIPPCSLSKEDPNDHARRNKDVEDDWGVGKVWIGKAKWMWCGGWKFDWRQSGICTKIIIKNRKAKTDQIENYAYTQPFPEDESSIFEKG